MGYEIVTATTIEMLVEKINLLHRQGWITQGGVSYSSKDKVYIQSMITVDTFDSKTEDYQPTEEILDPIGLDLFENSVPKESDPEFLRIVDTELSQKAAFLIYKHNILSIPEFLSKMNDHSFNSKADKKIIDELNNLITTKGWK